MLNKKKSFNHFYFIFLLIFFCGACNPSKKISQLNSSYLNINYENISEWVDWQTDFNREKLFFNKKNKLSTEGDIPLYIKTDFSTLEKVRAIKSVPLFILDTMNYNNGYYMYRENPSYFEDLNNVKAHYSSQIKDNYIIGKYKEELLNTGFSYQDIAFILMQFSIISTYDHLYAEMVIKKKIDTPDFHEIHYNCVYHICTNSCSDPKYKFFIRFDKKTRLITIGKS